MLVDLRLVTGKYLADFLKRFLIIFSLTKIYLLIFVIWLFTGQFLYQTYIVRQTEFKNYLEKRVKKLKQLYKVLDQVTHQRF